MMIFTYFQSLIISICLFEFFRRIEYFTKINPKLMIEPKSDINSDSGSELESDTDSGSDSGSDTDSEPESVSIAEPKFKPKPKPKPKSKSDSDSDSIDNQNIETISDSEIIEDEESIIITNNRIKSNVLILIKKNIKNNKKLFDILMDVDQNINVADAKELNNEMKKTIKLLF